RARRACRRRTSFRSRASLSEPFSRAPERGPFFWEDDGRGDFEGRGAARREARAARARRGRGRALPRPAERDPRGGRQGLRARSRRRPPDLASARPDQRPRRGRAGAVPVARGGARERARPGGRLLRGAARMTIDTLRLTAEEALELLERREVSAAE